MAMSDESIRSAALRCACMVAPPDADLASITGYADYFCAYIMRGGPNTPHTGSMAMPGELAPTPGEAAMRYPGSEGAVRTVQAQPAHHPPCPAHQGCPPCDMARARGEIQ